MLTNMEWGAVAYLTNSNYGRCSNGSCTEVTINNCSTFVTGIGAYIVSASSSSTNCTTDANKYNGEKGVLASTTGNVYGVYDMSGGSWEYVMGNMSSTADTYTFYNSSEPVPWFLRGGDYDGGSVAGVFHFSFSYGSAYSYGSARATLVGLS